MESCKSGSVTALPLKENMPFTQLLGLRLEPFSPGHFETYLRALSNVLRTSAGVADGDVICVIKKGSQ